MYQSCVAAHLPSHCLPFASHRQDSDPHSSTHPSPRPRTLQALHSLVPNPLHFTQCVVPWYSRSDAACNRTHKPPHLVLRLVACRPRLPSTEALQHLPTAARYKQAESLVQERAPGQRAPPSAAAHIHEQPVHKQRQLLHARQRLALLGRLYLRQDSGSGGQRTCECPPFIACGSQNAGAPPAAGAWLNRLMHQPEQPSPSQAPDHLWGLRFPLRGAAGGLSLALVAVLAEQGCTLQAQSPARRARPARRCYLAALRLQS